MAKNHKSSSLNSDIPNADGMKFAFVVAEWNSEITNNMFNHARETLLSAGAIEEDIERINVPGSFELIYGVKIASRNNYNAIICLGSIIKGETPHFEYICNAVSQGIKDLNIELEVPVIFGVLTDNDIQQARDRSGGKNGNKGIESAITAIKMAHLNK